MMTLATAVALGITHTLLGPDHYLPFIVIARARRWSLARASLLTFVCGLGHVGSSVVLGMAGAAAGAALGSLQETEELRGGLAAWSLLLFGVGYALFGLWRAFRKTSHQHMHVHGNGTLHSHGHVHDDQGSSVAVHEHRHDAGDKADEPIAWKQLTPWLLFVIFVLGPCEPLIPLFFAEAVQGAWLNAMWISLAYAAATLLVMHAIVALSWLGLRKVSFGPLERFGHVLAGGVMALAGAGMAFLGL